MSAIVNGDIFGFSLHFCWLYFERRLPAWCCGKYGWSGTEELLNQSQQIVVPNQSCHPLVYNWGWWGNAMMKGWFSLLLSWLYWKHFETSCPLCPNSEQCVSLSIKFCLKKALKFWYFQVTEEMFHAFVSDFPPTNAVNKISGSLTYELFLILPPREFQPFNCMTFLSLSTGWLAWSWKSFCWTFITLTATFRDDTVTAMQPSL